MVAIGNADGGEIDSFLFFTNEQKHDAALNLILHDPCPMVYLS